MRNVSRPQIGRSARASVSVPKCAAPSACAHGAPRCSATIASLPQLQRNVGLYRGNASRGLTASSSAAFGSTVRSSPATRLIKRGSPYIHAAAYRRGNSLIVCAALAGVEGARDVTAMVHAEVQGEENLVVGQLENGFRYVILPNKLPPKRFEAHLEIHAGSVDELEYERGVAHFVEHVTFLGSKKRENLLGTGSRANAYTDFHHTVFHVHAPIVNNVTGQHMLPQVLEALEEIAFKPEFLDTRIEKERKAVIAEAQMMNTIEYRVDCQLLQYLHEENNLGCRFPIGMMDQVKAWEHERLKDFWQKWYFPANATLYVVGDLDRNIEETQELIQKVFGGLHQAREPPQEGQDPALSPVKSRHSIRPPVEHKHGYGPLAVDEGPAKISIFRHPLLQHFMLSIFCKLPIQPMTTMGHMKQMLMMRIILSVYQFRINTRYIQADPPFMAIEIDISDSGREGCAVSTLTITSQPSDWRGAVQVGVQEVRRMQRHGLTKGELDRYRTAILRDSAQLAEQANKIPSSLACGHSVMGHKDAHKSMVAVAETISMEDINALAASMLTFASDYGNEEAMLKEAESEERKDAFSYLGPTRATSLVAAIPAYIDETGASVTEGVSVGRGAAAMGAGGHIDAEGLDLEALEKEMAQLDEFDVPEGAIRFNISADEIAEALADPTFETEAPSDVELPENLMTQEEVEALVVERNPHYIPIEGDLSSFDPAAPAPPREETFSGVVQRRLSNGVRINYRQTDNEPNGVLFRAICNGGRADEKMGAGPDGFGAVVVGTRVLSESGAMGRWGRSQVEVFCVSNLINCALEADEENIMMDFHCTVSEGGMEAMFQLLHLFLDSPKWEDSAMDRGKQAFMSSTKSIGKSLERATSDRIMATMMGTTERKFREPTPEEIDALTMDGMKSAVMSLLHAGNMEVNIVGDFDPDELESLLLRYVGTVKPREKGRDTSQMMLEQLPIEFYDPPRDERHGVWHLQDSDERACAYMAGPAPARWGRFGENSPLKAIEGNIRPPIQFVPASASPEDRAVAIETRRSHPLYSSITLMLLMEIINSRLFTTVRDSLGLTYDVSFEVTMLDRVRSGWFSVHVTSHPDKIYEALNASVAVLRDIRFSPINRRELARAKTTLLTRHESDMKNNEYWLGLITHLQNPLVPLKTATCLRDLKSMYEASTVEDIYDAYNSLHFDNERLYTMVGTSGKQAPPRPEFTLSKVAEMMGDEEEMPSAAPQAAAATATAAPPQAQAAASAGAPGANGQLDPMAMLTAIMAAQQAMKLKNAMDQMKQQQQQQQGGSSPEQK
eukprot:gene27064-2297_t